MSLSSSADKFPSLLPFCESCFQSYHDNHGNWLQVFSSAVDLINCFFLPHFMRNLNYYNGYSTSTVVDTSMSLIQKVMWHPHSDQYLTLLFSHDDLWLHCALCLYFGITTQEYPSKTRETEYVAFCFGSNWDWMRLTIFIIDKLGNISLYVL